MPSKASAPRTRLDAERNSAAVSDDTRAVVWMKFFIVVLDVSVCWFHHPINKKKNAPM
jgi:hypothetical protein